MIRTYTMRMKVTGNQQRKLDGLLDQLRELYNMALQQRRDAWNSHRKLISMYDQQRQLTDLRGGVEEYAQGPLMIQRDPLRRLDLAFRGFFRRIRNGENPGFPRFRTASRYGSFTVDKHNFTCENGRLRIVKLGTFRTKTGCHIKGKALSLHVKRCGNKWIAQIVCDIGEAPTKVAVSKAVGIDLGITSLATLSDGTEIPNPRWAKQEQDRLAVANRNLARKTRGSNNRVKAKEKLRRVHQRIAGLRSSYITGVAKQLVSNYNLIAHEDLKIGNMVRSNLAKSIMDAGWGQLIWRLQCEAEKAGKWLIPINPRGTTQKCSGCSAMVPKTLSQRRHNCPYCGLVLSRDHNAALNILALGESAVSKQNRVPV